MHPQAEAYVQRGWTPIPIPYGLKGDRGLAWGNITRDTALNYFNGEPVNIGILLGERSGNLIDVDIDAPDHGAGRIAARFLPETEWVFGRSSKPDSHRFYIDAIQPTPVRRERFINPITGELIAEIRGNGHYTMVGPSLHPSGEFVEGRLEQEPWVVDVERLREGCAALALVYTMASAWRPKNHHDLALQLAGALKRAGWSEDRTSAAVEAICEITGDGEVENRLEAVRDTYENPQPTGWPTLAKTLTDLGFDGPNVTTALRRMLRVKAEEARVVSLAGLTKTIATDLLNAEFPEPLWPVPGLIGGGLSLLVGAPKGGKSFLALQCALAIATGGIVGDMLPANEGTVVYYALEDTLPRLQRRLNKMLGDDVRPSLDHLVLVTGTVSGEDELAHHLGGLLEELRPILVVIDTLGMVRNNDERGSAYLGDYHAMSRLKQMADLAGSNLLVLHHIRKSAATDDLMTSVSGTYGVSGAADTVLRIRRHGSERRLEVDGRDIDGSKEWNVEFDKDRGLWLIGAEVTEESDMGSEKPVRKREEEKRRMKVSSYLLQRAGENPAEWVRKDDIEDNTGVSGGTLNRLLKELVDDGLVETRRGAAGGYRWAPERDDATQESLL